VPLCKYCKAPLPLDVVVLFCPDCGQSINLDAQATKQKTLKPVDIKSQYILTFIPFLNLIAARKLGTFKQSIARLIPDAFLLFIFLAMIAYPNTRHSNLLYFLITWLISSLVMLYFIRRWSVEWNKKLTFLQSMQ
jgi:hypothetical protein